MDGKDVRLAPMTAQMYHEYYREYRSDPDLCFDKGDFAEFAYDPEWVDRYVRRQADLNRRCFAIMHRGEMVGELILKDIVPRERATLSISMKHGGYKDRGFGTRAERLAIEYAFGEMGVKVLHADALVTNARSRHVLEKVGFHETHEDGRFAYYEIKKEEWKERS